MQCDKCKLKRIAQRCEDCGEHVGSKEFGIFRKQGSDCMHDNCPGCKNGTCSGVHMISCPCKKCTITML